jgi:RNA polymerase sigma factor for flagellar operon FliA
MNYNPLEEYRKASRQQELERLILDHLSYVRKILSTMTASLPSHVDREGLESAGVVGLVEAANNYDPTRGVAFKTYAFTRIRGAILDELRKTSPVSQQMQEQIGKLRDAHERLQPPVSPEDLAAATGMSLETVQRCLEAMRFITPQNWSDLYSTIHGSWRHQGDSPDASLDRAETQQILQRCIQKLPERERLVLTLYFLEDATLAEIGAALNLSESFVSRLLAAAKFRLKELFLDEIG